MIKYEYEYYNSVECAVETLSSSKSAMSEETKKYTSGNSNENIKNLVQNQNRCCLFVPYLYQVKTGWAGNIKITDYSVYDPRGEVAHSVKRAMTDWLYFILILFSR